LRNFDGFIFDVDGTLTSTNELIFATFNHVAMKYLNKTFTDEEITAMFGPTEDVILRQIMKDNFENARNDYLEFYSSMHHAMADVYPGIREVIEFLKSKNIPISIYTGKGRGSTEITLKKIGVYDLFDLIVSGDDIEGHKPSPEGVDLFIEKFNLNRSRVLMVGDAPADVLAARNSRIKVASVLWDSYAKEKVLKMDSDYFFETVSEFKKFLEENL
jgi:pyrophosphatase PpaX